MGMHNYRELKIWQRSMDFVVRVYKVCATFPIEEKYGLTSQLKAFQIYKMILGFYNSLGEDDQAGS